MTHPTFSRRTFVKTSASSLALMSLPDLVSAQSSQRTRLEWRTFRNTPQYASFLNAIGTMKANVNTASPASWAYWVNVHVNFCPHGTPRFLVWHRGFLYLLEQRMRIVSGDPMLTIPYWDYFSDPRIPSEFTDPARSNPLYVPRIGSSVYNALDLSPFAPGVFNFQRGTVNAFETLLEAAPHNPVHNLIGGFMANMQSPVDPIFFLHHANVDRLWHAWALPDGKGIPYCDNPYSAATSSPYWAGTLTYAPGLSLPTDMTYHPSWLSYDYDNLNTPVSLPPQAASRSGFIQVSADAASDMGQARSQRMLKRPADGTFAQVPARVLSANHRSVGGVKDIGLDERSASATIRVVRADKIKLRSIAAAHVATSKSADSGLQSVSVVLDDIKVSGDGKLGGFYYDVYLNLPLNADLAGNRKRYLLGTLGAFELAGAAHHAPGTLSYPATEVLMNLAPGDFDELTVSLVRVNGGNAPTGPVLRIGELRIEIAATDAFVPAEPASRMRKNAYSMSRR